MRPPVDERRVRELARHLGHAAHGPTRIYLTGGASAVLEGWRVSTIDIDMRFEPEADELLRELPRLKEQMGVNVELTSPPDFIPELPGWRDRSPFVLEEGNLAVHHFDFYSQALSTIERSFRQDLDDVREMLARGLVDAPAYVSSMTRSNRSCIDIRRSIPERLDARWRPYSDTPRRARTTLSSRGRRPADLHSDRSRRLAPEVDHKPIAVRQRRGARCAGVLTGQDHSSAGVATNRRQP